MSFQIFNFTDSSKLDAIVGADPIGLGTLKKIASAVGEALPAFLIEYLQAALKAKPGTLAIHTSSSIQNYGSSADLEAISRTRGFLGKPQLEEGKFPNAIHHVKILHNGAGKARVFYKNLGGVQFIQNLSS